MLRRDCFEPKSTPVVSTLLSCCSNAHLRYRTYPNFPGASFSPHHSLPYRHLAFDLTTQSYYQASLQSSSTLIFAQQQSHHSRPHLPFIRLLKLYCSPHSTDRPSKICPGIICIYLQPLLMSTYEYHLTRRRPARPSSPYSFVHYCTATSSAASRYSTMTLPSLSGARPHLLIPFYITKSR